MPAMQRTASNVELVGGRLCLDFANTVSTRSEGLGREYLNSYDDLLVWVQRAGILAEDEVQGLRERAARYPELAAAALQRAIAFRETIYRFFSATAKAKEPKGADLAEMNRVVQEALSRLAITPSAEGYEWSWVTDEEELDGMLWPIARSAAELLTSRELGRVRRCAREGCDWLFVDRSKNQSRRWCSMSLCGSRVKARRYYRRTRGRK
jgi:predicted RNA-binding Zn ribbon-like protein